jgi:iron(III) transport system substrate-binding protein
MKLIKKGMLLILGVLLIVSIAGCSSQGDATSEIIIYSNGDEEAIQAMEKALDNNGYEGKYILKSFGTSELGGKLIAEGNNIEANIITMSSYFVESAQKQNEMFVPYDVSIKSINNYPDYYKPILSNTGALFYNKEVLKEEGLEVPTSVKDLTKDAYKDFVSIPSMLHSSTGWLLVQSIFSEYGEDEGKVILEALINNCGPHLESSGSGPIKKVRSGEVAVGFGLRHQAVADAADGLPIQFIDPVEGNFSLEEVIAVVDKDEEVNQLAKEMTEVILSEGREDLISYYPVKLYEDESVNPSNEPGNSKVFSEALTVDLLEKHQVVFKELSE